MKRFVVVITLSIFSINLFSKELGEIFDCLSGKYDNSAFQSFIKNEYPDRWFHDRTFAYNFSRFLFENYSVEINLSNEILLTPKIIHQIWLGGGIPQKYVAWMDSWPRYHPLWTYIIWTDDDIPYLILVNKHLFDRAINYGEKADILRLELINIFGGLYVDTDYECLNRFDRFHYSNKFYTGALGGFNLNNALIGASKGHPLIKKLIQELAHCAHLKEMSERTGPKFFTRVFFENASLWKDSMVAYPMRYFCPCQDTSKAYGHIISYARHWWAASWQKSHVHEPRVITNNNVEKNLTPIYFEKKQSITISDFDASQIIERIAETFSIKTIIELGACNFLINEHLNEDIQYIALSPLKFLVLDYRIRYSQENRSYLWKDWTQELIPAADLLIIGDILEYLSFDDCDAIIKKITENNTKFILMAHNENVHNIDTELGKQRLLNMCQQPFNLEKPEVMLNIDGNSYGLWKIRTNKENIRNEVN